MKKRNKYYGIIAIKDVTKSFSFHKIAMEFPYSIKAYP